MNNNNMTIENKGKFKRKTEYYKIHRRKED